MTVKRLLAVLGTFIIIIAGCSNSKDNENSKQSSKSNNSDNPKTELKVSAAASLSDVSKALKKEFEKTHKNVNVTFNYGGSGALRQQIEKGAPTDVFMSANTKDVEMLKEHNQAHDTYKYAHNQLVLIGDKNSDQASVKDLKDNEKLAIGEVKTVPAGKYAKQYLDNQHLYSDVKDKIVYAKDVKQVLNYVEKGNTQMGFVYETDLYTNNERTDKVNEIKKADLKKPITYEAGATSDNKFAKEWIEFLKSKKAKDILKEYHFKV